MNLNCFKIPALLLLLFQKFTAFSQVISSKPIYNKSICKVKITCANSKDTVFYLNEENKLLINTDSCTDCKKLLVKTSKGYLHRVKNEYYFKSSREGVTEISVYKIVERDTLFAGKQSFSIIKKHYTFFITKNININKEWLSSFKNRFYFDLYYEKNLGICKRPFSDIDLFRFSDEYLIRTYEFNQKISYGTGNSIGSEIGYNFLTWLGINVNFNWLYGKSYENVKVRYEDINDKLSDFYLKQDILSKFFSITPNLVLKCNKYKINPNFNIGLSIIKNQLMDNTKFTYIDPSTPPQYGNNTYYRKIKFSKSYAFKFGVGMEYKILKSANLIFEIITMINKAMPIKALTQKAEHAGIEQNLDDIDLGFKEVIFTNNSNDVFLHYDHYSLPHHWLTEKPANQYAVKIPFSYLGIKLGIRIYPFKK